MMTKATYQLLFALLILLISVGASAQTIIVDGDDVLVSDQAKFPFWLKAGQTLAASTNVVSISVIEYNVLASPAGGNVLTLEQVVKVTTNQTVPANKAWKVEAVLLDPALATTSPQTTNAITYWNGTNTTSSTITANPSNGMYWDNVSGRLGIGTSSPAATVDVDGDVQVSSLTANSPVYTDANSKLTTTVPSSSALTIKKGQYTLVSGITYHGITPTNTYNIPVTLPANTKAIFIACYYRHSGTTNHGYLNFKAYQAGATIAEDKTTFINQHYDDYYNTDYYELMVPWNNSGLGNSVTIEVTSSHNTSSSNSYNIYYAGYIAGD